jgi:peptide/nickel transport system permease protein
MGLSRYLIKRLLMVIPTLLGVTLITFTLTYLLPGNPAVVKAGPFATPEYLALMEKEMGLDQPVYVQYWRYLVGVTRGDLGQSSSTGRPVLEDFLQRIPATLELTLTSLLIAVGIGIPLAVISAVRRDSLLDHACRIVGVGGVAMPTFWTGILLLYIFFYYFGLAPPPLGRLSPGVSPPTSITGLYTIDSLLTGNFRALLSSLHHLLLPSVTLGFSVMAPLTRMVRATMLEVLSSDYIKAAEASGLPHRQIVYGDALRNTLIPVITLIGVIFGFLMGGNVVVELVFGWPGIGNYAVTSLMSKDAQPIQSFVLFVSVVYVMVNLIVDIAYGVADPRIRLR